MNEGPSLKYADAGGKAAMMVVFPASVTTEQIERMMARMLASGYVEHVSAQRYDENYSAPTLYFP